VATLKTAVADGERVTGARGCVPGGVNAGTMGENAVAAHVETLLLNVFAKFRKVT